MKSLKLYLIIAGLLITVYVIAQLNRPKAVDWSETLRSGDKIPFGTYILKQRLKDVFPNTLVKAVHQPVYNVIAEDSIKNALYIIVCPGIELTKADYGQLKKYLEAGNDVFIAAEYFGKLIKKELNTETFSNFLDRKTIKVRFLNKNLDTNKYYAVDKGAGNNYFGGFDTSRAIVLGKNANHKANFIKYQFGKGSLYLAANPKFFSNYGLLTLDGAQYAAIALSHLNNTGKLVFDEYYSQGSEGEFSPMKVFLSRPFLKWAYYISIFSLLFYVLYEIKRRQRIIPLIEPLKNSTLEFVTVVGQVYYEKRNNADMANKKITYLLEHLRDRYQIKTNNLDDDFIEKLSSKLAIEPNFAREVVDYIRYIKVQENVTDRELVELNKLIEKLYMQAS